LLFDDRSTDRDRCPVLDNSPLLSREKKQNAAREGLGAGVNRHEIYAIVDDGMLFVASLSDEHVVLRGEEAPRE